MDKLSAYNKLALADDPEIEEYLEQAREKRKARVDRTKERIESGEMVEEEMEMYDKVTDLTQGDLTQEEKEQLAEEEYKKKRKELGYSD